MESLLHNISVLIVDDERNIRKTVSRAFTDLGAITTTAATGLEALDHIRETHIDVVLLDLKLPHIGGLEVLQLIRREHPTLPVVIFTAHGTPEIAAKAMKLGAADYLAKPFTPEEVRTAVIHAIEKAPKPRHQLPEATPSAPADQQPAPPSCILVIISNPDTARHLLRIASGVAQDYTHSEVFALSPVIVPLQTPLALSDDQKEGLGEAQKRALEITRNAAQDFGISLRSQLFWAHHASRSVLDFADEHNASHLILEWSENPPEASCISLSDVQRIARKASTEVMLVRSGDQAKLQHIAALVSRSAHATQAARRAWALARNAGISRLNLIHALKPSADDDDQRRTALQLIHQTANEAGIPQNKYDATVLLHEDPQQTLLTAITDFDTVCVGATEKTWLAQTLFGSVPNSIKNRFDGTVVVVQGSKSDHSTIIDMLADRLAG